MTATTTQQPVGSLRINDVAPNFVAETTEGTIDFHDWIGSLRIVSHPTS